jgi:hypothetical protein
VDRYSFIVMDSHHLLLAGLPAHPITALQAHAGEPLKSTLRWCIAAAAAQRLDDERASPFSDDERIEVSATSRIEEGAIRWRILLVWMCR